MFLRSAADLVASGLVSSSQYEAMEALAKRFPISITSTMAALIDSNTDNDPIARQFIPHIDENITSAGDSYDPVGDYAHMPVPGLIHRYPDRVLLKIVNSCLVYCRFCFRRSLIGPGTKSTNQEKLTKAYNYIKSCPDIWEVILSGGDPLILAPHRLFDIFSQLTAIDHVAVVRLHSRVPVVAPEKIDDALLSAFRLVRDRGRTMWILLHANHAREFTPEALGAIQRLVKAGIPLLGQSVLLKGVNDTHNDLRDLFCTMIKTGIKPHYLHHPDRALGTAHFQLPLKRGIELVTGLRGVLSGLCQPSYMLDIPGGYGKVPVFSATATSIKGAWEIRDPYGELHIYQDDIQD